MVWAIHVSTTRHGDRCVLVKASWTALGSIDDVSLDCGRGVHPIGVEDLGRREMNAFSRPLKGVFRWDDSVLEPSVFLTWCDTGETCEKVIGLAREDHDSRPWPRHLGAGLRTLLGQPMERRRDGARRSAHWAETRDRTQLLGPVSRPRMSHRDGSATVGGRL
jgi:hypothetical protein